MALYGTWSVPRVQCHFCDEMIAVGTSDPRELKEPFEPPCSKYGDIGKYWRRDIEGWKES